MSGNHPMPRPGASLLETGSNALYQALETTFDQPQMSLVEEAFRISMRHNSSAEIPLKRFEGASFNPRPGRIGRILLKECRERSAQVHMGAFLSCCGEGPLNSFDIPTALRPAAAMAQEALSLLSAGTPTSDEAERIALALLLDQVRHLHMSTLAQEEREAICSKALQKVLPAASNPSSARLKMLIEEAIAKFRIRRS